MERRKFSRLESYNILRCQKYTMKESSDHEMVLAAFKDISAGGLLFECKRKYDIGNLLKLEIVIPGWEKFKSEFYKPDESSRSKPLIALASVVRVEMVKPGLYDIGVSIAGIDEGHQSALLQYIQRQPIGVMGRMK